MSDLPTDVRIYERRSPRGFQFEKGLIATAAKIRLIDSLSETGLRHIQIRIVRWIRVGAGYGRCGSRGARDPCQE